jgi:amidase
VSHPRNMGQLRPPSADDLQRLAARDGLELARAEAESLALAAAGMLRLLDEVEELPPVEIPVRYPRGPGRRPTQDEDPYNAFVRLCNIEGAPEGPLRGLRIGIKDSLAIAGVPTSNGSRTLAHVPTEDAVVVERILSAGGTIAGTTNLDDFSGSGLGLTSVHGPARNPLDPTRSCGGSSGGSAAAVAGGLVDLALGVDGGGSVRMPAAQCGVVGLKPTHGLVPTAGLSAMDHTLDTIGPIGRSVHDVALLLSVIAGEDWRDPQWTRGVVTGDYLGAAGVGVEALRVGVIAESLDADLCEPAVLAGVEAASAALEAAGATVSRVTVPLWRSAFPIWVGVLLGGLPAGLRANGVPYGTFGRADVERAHTAGLVRQTEGALLPPTLKIALLLHSYLDERYHQVPLARAQNQRLALRRDLDAALSSHDVLLAPTVPRVAPRLPEGRVSDEEAMALMVSETVLAAPLNATGHPALAVPSGTDAEGLPTSVQVIGRRWDDERVIAAGAAVERVLDLKIHGR